MKNGEKGRDVDSPLPQIVRQRERDKKKISVEKKISAEKKKICGERRRSGVHRSHKGSLLQIHKEMHKRYKFLPFPLFFSLRSYSLDSSRDIGRDLVRYSNILPDTSRYGRDIHRSYVVLFIFCIIFVYHVGWLRYRVDSVLAKSSNLDS